MRKETEIIFALAGAEVLIIIGAILLGLIISQTISGLEGLLLSLYAFFMIGGGVFVKIKAESEKKEIKSLKKKK